MKTTDSPKKDYEQPKIEMILLDNQISLAMASDNYPEEEPEDWVYSMHGKANSTGIFS